MSQPPAPGPDLPSGGSYGQSYPPPGYGAFPPGFAGPRTTPLAVVSLVTGLVGLPCCLFVVLGLVAVGTGVAAQQRIRRQPAHWKGSGLAIAGITLGALEVVLALVYWVLLLTGQIHSSFTLRTAP